MMCTLYLLRPTPALSCATSLPGGSPTLLRYDAVVCVTELMQRTLAHAAGLPTVELVLDKECVMVVLTSHGPTVGRPATRPDDLGTLLLTELADDWDDDTAG